jgi:hypothetical protein
MTLVTTLRHLEERLLTSTSGEELRLLLADEFREFGASGNTYEKPEVIALLLKTNPRTAELRDLRIMELCEGVVLLTYQAIVASRSTNRSSIWRRTESRWQLIFHQGTVRPGLQ